MDLWIRSQDRECLMKVDRIDYDNSTGKHYIVVNGFKTYLGRYKSKERALEVLDEIQGLIKYKLETAINKDGINIEVKDLSYDIYVMPEE